MSGGSLNYLYCQEAEELFSLNRIDDMEYAECYLIDRGDLDIAKDIRRLIEYVLSVRNRVEVLQEQLRNVFHAIEWRISADYGDSDLEEELEKYRNRTVVLGG